MQPMSELRVAASCSATGAECWNLAAFQAYAEGTEPDDVVCSGSINTSTFGNVCTAVIEVSVGNPFGPIVPTEPIAIEPVEVVPGYQMVEPAL